MYFPQELIHQIVAFIQDDRRTLATVRLVSHNWNISSRIHLFHSLDLLISERPESVSASALHSSSGRPFHVFKGKSRGIKKFETVLSLLETSADMSHCVREVSLGRTTSFSSTDPKSHEQQNRYAVFISSILSRIDHLSDVVFREINWTNLSPPFLSCILDICKTRTLERIDMWNCQMPTASSLLDFLAASKNIKSLRLSYFRILNIDIDATKLSPPVDHAMNHSGETGPRTSLLQSLTIDAAPEAHIIFGLLPYSISFLQLRQLHLSDINTVVRIAEFLQTAGHSLEFLDMRFVPRQQIQPKPSCPDLDLSLCPRLQHLRISGLHWTPSVCPSEYLSSLFKTSESDQSLPIECLQLLVIALKPKATTQVDLSDNQNGSESATSLAFCQPTELRYSDWIILDTILSSHLFRALKKFQISTTTVLDGAVDLSRLSDMFPKIKSKGVQVTCTGT